MNKQTIKALKGSIRKWERIYWGIGSDEASSNCDLCSLFVDDCEECPVLKDSLEKWCSNTPYEKWILHRKVEHEIRIGVCECVTCTDLALAEANYLKDLLNKAVKNEN